MGEYGYVLLVSFGGGIVVGMEVGVGKEHV